MDIAKIVKCSDTDPYHSYLDFCWRCAPYWDSFPVCPTCGRKLTTGAKHKVFHCSKCRKRYRLPEGAVV